MDSHRLSRRTFVARGVASAMAAGVALEAVSKAGAAGQTDDLIVGRFASAHGARQGVVSIAGGRSVPVMLDSGAFVAHGAEGIVDGLTAFVPGEQVMVRGVTSEWGVTAVELQSVYRRVTGTVTVDGAAYVLATPFGQRVRVPKQVAQLHVPAGVRSGATYSASIWSDPATGEATAVDLSPGN